MRTLLIFLLAFNASSKVLNFETTRMKSTGGAGVASILMNEATVINPAPLAFFNMSALYFEKFSTERTLKDSDKSLEDSNFAIIASDSSKNLKGSIAYIKTKSGENSQKQLNLAFASTLGKKSAGGLTYRDVEKSYRYKGKVIKRKYKQMVPGVFHAVSNNFNIGFVAIDPLRKVPRESKIILGTQWTIFNYVSLILDLGTDYKSDMQESSLVRGGSQVRIFDNFYLRFGAFEDKALKERGSGLGIGWVQPKLVLDFAVKNTKVREDVSLQQDSEDIKETSFSLAYRF